MGFVCLGLDQKLSGALKALLHTASRATNPVMVFPGGKNRYKFNRCVESSVKRSTRWHFVHSLFRPGSESASHTNAWRTRRKDLQAGNPSLYLEVSGTESQPPDQRETSFASTTVGVYRRLQVGLDVDIRVSDAEALRANTNLVYTVSSVPLPPQTYATGGSWAILSYRLLGGGCLWGQGLVFPA